MSSFLSAAGFNELLSTFLSWGIAFVVLWGVSRFILVKKNALVQAKSLIKRVRDMASALSVKIIGVKEPDVNGCISSLRSIKRTLLKADKMLSIFQYEHNDIMDVLALRGSMTKLIKLCDAVMELVADGKTKGCSYSFVRFDKICEDALSIIDNISKIQARKKMLQV